MTTESGAVLTIQDDSIGLTRLVCELPPDRVAVSLTPDEALSVATKIISSVIHAIEEPPDLARCPGYAGGAGGCLHARSVERGRPR